MNSSGRDSASAVSIPLALHYEDLHIESAYRLDLLVEQGLVLELKSVESLLPIHTAQLLSYLKLGAYPLGLLLNFNTVHLRDGIKRIVHNF